MGSMATAGATGTLTRIMPGSGLVPVPAASWAGPEYVLREPVREQQRTTWCCLECSRAGSAGNAIPPEQDARRHADESRHLVQVTSVVTYIPGERS